MDKIVFSGYTVQDLLIAGGVIVALLVVFKILKGLFKKKETSEHVQVTRCKNCGWQGQISKYAGVCPKCNKPLGDRIAKTE